MSSCEQLLQLASLRLAQAGIEGPRRDALALLTGLCGIAREDLLRQPDLPLGAARRRIFEAAIERREAREPVSRILGRRQFWGLEFEITPAVLDPRPDSEILVQTALAATRDLAQPKVLDLGTGTGCLLLAYLHERPDATGTGVDLSPQAVAVARRNAGTLGLAGRAVFKTGDWTDGLAAEDPEPAFNLILCNPPYICDAEMLELAPEVGNFDPHLALLGGADGLRAYKQILRRINNIIFSPAWVFFECGAGQGGDLSKMLEIGGFAHVGLEKDLAGHDRVVFGRLRAAAKKD